MFMSVGKQILIYVLKNKSKLFIFLKMGQSRPLFVYFRSFHIPIQMTNIQFEKSVDGVLGIRTADH